MAGRKEKQMRRAIAGKNDGYEKGVIRVLGRLLLYLGELAQPGMPGGHDHPPKSNFDFEELESRNTRLFLSRIDARLMAGSAKRLDRFLANVHVVNYSRRQRMSFQLSCCTNRRLSLCIRDVDTT